MLQVGLDKAGLQKKVFGGIARDGQLRKSNDISVQSSGAAQIL
jgi:hypothetical protein